VTLEDNHGKTVNNIYEVAAVLFALLREDILYSDLHSYRYTVTKQEGYYSYSDIFRMRFPIGYGCDSIGRVYPTTARRVNFSHLNNVLTSQDEAVFKENSWIWDGEFRFLDGQSISGNKIGFTSFPRSGNSFLRRYVEQITGITTGSSINIHTSTSLQIMGLKGESHIDDSVWIAKSHHPFFINGVSLLPSNKTFICIRNPLDVLPSYASLCSTLSHGNKPDYDFSVDYPEWWAWFIRKQVKNMKKFFEILIRHCNQDKRNPLYIVRYEDLVTDPKDTLMGLMSFLLEKQGLAGSNVERRIEQVLQQGSAAAQTYKLKATTGKFDVHRKKYSPEQLAYIKETLVDQLYYFGYANVEENPTGFFEFSEHTQENLSLHNKFRSDSKAALDEVCSETRTVKTYVHS